MENVEKTVADLDGLGTAVHDICQQVTQSLEKANRATQTYMVNTGAAAVRLEKELLVLRMGFGSLKAAMTDAMTPIGAVVLPMINQAIRSVTKFVKSAGLVIAALLGGEEAGNAMKEGMNAATKSGEKAASSGKKISRTLAGFDQITRLQSVASGGGSGSSVSNPAVTLPETVTDTLSPQLQVIVEKIRALLEPLRNIDFTALLERLSGLGAAFAVLGDGITQALQWVWFQVLTPFVVWVSEQFAPGLAGTLTAAVQVVTAALSPAAQGFGALLQSMQPVADFVSQTVLLVLSQLQTAFALVAGVFTDRGGQITAIFQNIGTVAAAVFAAVQPILTTLRDQWDQVFQSMCITASDSLGWIIDALGGLSTFVAGVFTGQWELAWSGLKDFLKSIVNGVIGLINSMLRGVTGAVNGIIGIANRLSFTVPAWVPELGGKTFGLHLSTVTAPQIPYLAQGAVLPANKPFMAVVGDQRHGTNIEAPLATIQEAVALVMQDQTSAIMAGVEASVGVQREILEAVLGIHIGDDVIANATGRYQSRLATMRGGAL